MRLVEIGRIQKDLEEHTEHFIRLEGEIDRGQYLVTILAIIITVVALIIPAGFFVRMLKSK